MPNIVRNSLFAYGDKERLQELRERIKGTDRDIDFNKIIPMPDNIYCGPLGEKEIRQYGKNNWYDWSRKNWWTKWNAWDTACSFEEQGEKAMIEISFSTAWNSPDPILQKIAEMFPDLRFEVLIDDEGIDQIRYMAWENGVQTEEQMLDEDEVSKNKSDIAEPTL